MYQSVPECTIEDQSGARSSTGSGGRVGAGSMNVLWYPRVGTSSTAALVLHHESAPGPLVTLNAFLTTDDSDDGSCG